MAFGQVDYTGVERMKASLGNIGKALLMKQQTEAQAAMTRMDREAAAGALAEFESMTRPDPATGQPRDPEEVFGAATAAMSRLSQMRGPASQTGAEYILKMLHERVLMEPKPLQQAGIRTEKFYTGEQKPGKIGGTYLKEYQTIDAATQKPIGTGWESANLPARGTKGGGGPEPTEGPLTIYATDASGKITGIRKGVTQKQVFQERPRVQDDYTSMLVRRQPLKNALESAKANVEYPRLYPTAKEDLKQAQAELDEVDGMIQELKQKMQAIDQYGKEQEIVPVPGTPPPAGKRGFSGKRGEGF